MSKLIKYQVSTNHREAVQAAGFDLDDPDLRHPVKNMLVERLINQNPKALSNRAAELVNARTGIGKQLARALTILVGFTLSIMEAPNAYAVGEELIDKAHDANSMGTEIRISLENVWNTVIEVVSALPPLEHSIWPVSLLSGILTCVLGSFVLQVQSTHRKKEKGGMKRVKVESAKEDTAETLASAKAVDSPVISQPSQHYWTVAGATRTGKIREENQDALKLHQPSSAEALMVVCDGAGRVQGAREAALSGVEQIFVAMTNPLEGNLPDKAIRIAQRHANQKHLNGITTAIVAWFKGNWLHYATVGDGELAIIWPDGMVSHILAPHHVIGEPTNKIAGYIGQGCTVAPRTGSIRLEPGCLVLAMSDGAGDIFPYDDLARHRVEYLSALNAKKTNVVNDLLDQLEEARHPESGAYYHQDNMTLAMAGLNAAAEMENSHDNA